MLIDNKQQNQTELIYLDNQNSNIRLASSFYVCNYFSSRYGIRVNPFSWLNLVYGQYHKDGEFPILWMLGCKLLSQTLFRH